MKTKIANIIKKVLPWKWYKLLVNKTLVVPAYYRRIIADSEKYFDLALDDCYEKDILLVRKYAHIIDKGLQREDAEPGHSKKYYQLLKTKLDSIPQKNKKNDPSLQWAKKVLSQYEQLQNGQFQHLEESVTAQISYSELLSLIKTRRSNRYFKEQTIDQDEVNKLLEVVNWSANSCNKQPIQVFYSLDSNQSKLCLSCCKGGTGFGDNVPAFFAFCADSRGYVWPSETYLPHIDVSLGAQNFFLAATTLGLSGTILSWAQKSSEEEIELRKLLNIPEYFIIVFCSVLGYASKNNPTPLRKTIN